MTFHLTFERADWDRLYAEKAELAARIAAEPELRRAVIVKCRVKGCKAVRRFAQAVDRTVGVSNMGRARIEHRPTGRFYDAAGERVASDDLGCGHGRTTMTPVNGYYNAEKGCDGRCMNARGSDCECSCGGENHGINHFH